MSETRFVAQIPLTLDCPPAMAAAVKYVFDGEYESHHDGTGLDILDIGANVGSFARWANLRWPESRIRCFEPNPGTFEFLKRNVSGFSNIMPTNAAVYPGTGAKAEFFARYAGDGEAGLVSYATDTFRAGAVKDTFEVSVVAPQSLPSADIVKLDVEGAEAAILSHLDLSKTQLVLAEFQNRKNRIKMQEVLKNGFVPLVDDECPWDPILDYLDYRQDLKGDVYGRMFYVRPKLARLVHRPPAKA